MNLNADGVADIVIFDKTSSRILTYLAKDNSYHYAPEYEIYFPTDISTFFVLYDYNCDGKKDIFTFGQIGIFVYRNVTEVGKPPSWKKLSFYTGPGLKSEVLLTQGNSLINLLPGTNDLPHFADMDGDGDMDVLNMKFVSPSQAEYHRNFSVENNHGCDSLELVRQTQTWGGFLECSCGKIAFNGQTCADIGGRVEQTEHTGGKSLLTLDMDNDGDRELIFSEETCQSLYYMRNDGDVNNAVLNSASLFPSAQPVALQLFPAAYLEDVDFDGKADLLSSPNLYLRTDVNTNFKSSVWLYKNTGSAALPNFTFVKNNFLQDDMIDEGDFSSPAFTDIDGDGDQDMFVGKYVTGVFQTSISFYQNIGTAIAPSFKFITDDFTGMARFLYYNIKPQFVDIDKNGIVDLAFVGTSAQNGRTRVYYILSSSATVPLFGGQSIVNFPLVLNASDNATVVDIDRDGNVDILVGTSTGALQYWRNSGTNTFALINDKYLGLGESILRQNPSVAVGDVDHDGREDMIIGDQAGILSLYSDFRSAGSNPEPLKNLIYDSFSQSYTSKNLGGKVRPTIANLFGTDKPEVIVGNSMGGLHVLKNDNGLAYGEEMIIGFYPNPVQQEQALFIMPDRNVTMEIYSVLGKRIGTSVFIPGNQTLQYTLRGISAGVYIARFKAGGKSLAKRFVVL